jgi:hypothetical protein
VLLALGSVRGRRPSAVRSNARRKGPTACSVEDVCTSSLPRTFRFPFSKALHALAQQQRLRVVTEQYAPHLTNREPLGSLPRNCSGILCSQRASHLLSKTHHTSQTNLPLQYRTSEAASSPCGVRSVGECRHVSRSCQAVLCARVKKNSACVIHCAVVTSPNQQRSTIN